MLAIKGGKLITVTHGIIDDGVILIDGGVIREIGGSSMGIPDGCEVEDVHGAWIYPGFVEVSSHIGANRQPSDFINDLKDGVHDGIDQTEPLSPELRVAWAVNPQDNTIKWVQSSGITTCFIAPGPGCLIDGQGMAFKIRPAESIDDILIPGSEQMCFTLGDEVTAAFRRRKMNPSSRMRVVEMLLDVLDRAVEYAHTPETERKRDAKLEALVPAVTGRQKVRFECLRGDDIVTAIKISEKFGLDYIITGAFESCSVPEFIAAHGARVALEAVPFGPERCMPMIHRFNFAFETAAMLEERGCLAAITVNENGQTRRLPILAGFATAYGLSEQSALESITIRPARLLGLDSRIGSLEPGKDADLAIYSGNALSNFSRCMKVMSEGRWVFDGEGECV